MAPRSLLLSLVASAGLALPAAADRLIVADPTGFLYQADTTTGVFEPFAGPCIGSLTMLAADGQRLFGVNEFDMVLVFDLASGAWLNAFQPNVGTIDSLTAGAAGLFVGTTDGLVARLDPVTGLVLDTRTTPDGVRALLLHGNDLFVGSTNGAIYRGDAAGGEFTYFSCFCFVNITRMMMESGDMLVADELGTVVRVDVTNGNLLAGIRVFGLSVAAVSEGALLLYYEGGVIPRVNARTGEAMAGSFQSPGSVSAVLALNERSGPRAGQRSKGSPKMP